MNKTRKNYRENRKYYKKLGRDRVEEQFRSIDKQYVPSKFRNQRGR